MKKLKCKPYSPSLQSCSSNWAHAANGISWAEGEGWQQSLKSHSGGLAFPRQYEAAFLGRSLVCSINFSRRAACSLPSFSSLHTEVARVGSCLQVCSSVSFLHPLGKDFFPSIAEAEIGGEILAKYNTSNTHGSAG